MRLYYTLKTLDPVIVSQNNATTNNHECLDYIPGSAILGAMAANHYAGLDQDQSWAAFHNGECRFSPCYPVINNQISLPTPASWHFSKGSPVIEYGKYNANEISNHAAVSFKRQQDTQYKQCRDGYVTANATTATIKHGLSTKTAIDAHKGKAKDGQLFSYAYLEAGQVFAGWIDCENAPLAERFSTSLNQTLRVGRSRNTEFGRVQLNLVCVEEPSEPVATDKHLVLWCLSDCELLDKMGMPTLKPAAASVHPGLEGRLNRDHSFIRSARISRFNQKRRGLDSEQVLISKGSVLVFDLDEKPTAEILQAISRQGIGLNRQQGLGWVSVNPSWASQPQLSGEQLFSPICVARPHSTHTAPAANSVLIQWVSERVGDVKTANDAQQAVNQRLKAIYLGYKNARRYNNILNRNEAGPSSTQWRRIADVVRHAANDASWHDAVFTGESAICKANNDELGWGIDWHNGKQLITFADMVKSELENQSVTTMRLLLEQLCRYDLSTFNGLNKLAKEYKLDQGDQ